MGFFIPGTAALILLFTAIFSTISIIEDRREGFLQGVLVSPAKRWGIALGKSLGGAAIAWAQAAFFLLLSVLIGMVPMALGLGEGGEQNAPLARAVIGGLFLATIATLFFVPSVFALLHRVRPARAHAH